MERDFSPERLNKVEEAESLEELYGTTNEELVRKGGFEKEHDPGAKARQLEDAKALHRHFVSRAEDAHAVARETGISASIAERFLARLAKLELRELGISHAFSTGLLALEKATSVLQEEQPTIREKRIDRTRRGKIEQTAGDLRAEDIIIETIKKDFPDDFILSEEIAKSGAVSLPANKEKPVWYVDPLDGTRSYGSNRLTYATMLARAVGGRLQFGIIVLPAKGEIYYAAHGTGAFQNKEQIHVSDMAELKDGFLELNQSRPGGPAYVFDEKKLGVPIFSRVVPVESEGVAFTTLARGNSLAHVAVSPKPWDVMPGLILVEEAGGKVSNIKGHQYDPYHPKKILVATNGAVHGLVRHSLHNARVL